MAGAHQMRNAGLAIAMLRLAPGPQPSDADIARGVADAQWPGRMQLLGPGPLTRLMPEGHEIWIDGGHNLDAAQQVAAFLGTTLAKREPIDLVLGMLANKDAGAFLRMLAPHVRRVMTVPISGHDHHDPAELAKVALDAGIVAAEPRDDVSSAVRALAVDNPARTVLIGGSLYLVGQALDFNEEWPV